MRFYNFFEKTGLSKNDKKAPAKLHGTVLLYLYRAQCVHMPLFYTEKPLFRVLVFTSTILVFRHKQRNRGISVKMWCGLLLYFRSCSVYLHNFQYMITPQNGINSGLVRRVKLKYTVVPSFHPEHPAKFTPSIFYFSALRQPRRSGQDCTRKHDFWLSFPTLSGCIILLLWGSLHNLHMRPAW